MVQFSGVTQGQCGAVQWGNTSASLVSSSRNMAKGCVVWSLVFIIFGFRDPERRAITDKDQVKLMTLCTPSCSPESQMFISCDCVPGEQQAFLTFVTLHTQSHNVFKVIKLGNS